MSWWISLVHPETEDCAEVTAHSEGGTYALGGTPDATLNVTYNYGRHFDFWSLKGKTGGETIPILEQEVQRLGTERDADYWNSTPGNVGFTLRLLLRWAKDYPGYRWRVH